MDTSAILSKLKAASVGGVLEKVRFGRSTHLSLWVETRALTWIATFVKNDPEICLDWVENLSAAQIDGAIVLTYFLRSSLNANALILRCSLQPPGPSREVDIGSVAGIWAMAVPFEEEIQEMFGVRFTDAKGATAHQSAGRLAKGWNGFPLRKTYVFPTEFLGIAHSRNPALRKGPEGHA